jgi:NadR type nicotinamide-nucleotide adenylyltransferase
MDIFKVCIIGADSTGKTTLARNLAAYYGTAFVPEYAREFIEAHDGTFNFNDMPTIVEAQLLAEAKQLSATHRVLFCDGSALANCIWSERYFGRSHPKVIELANASSYDLFLLTRIDVPWKADAIRDSKGHRKWLDTRFEAELTKRGWRYVSIDGSWDRRFATSVRHVNELLNIDLSDREATMQGDD